VGDWRKMFWVARLGSAVESALLVNSRCTLLGSVRLTVIGTAQADSINKEQTRYPRKTREHLAPLCRSFSIVFFISSPVQGLANTIIHCNRSKSPRALRSPFDKTEAKGGHDVIPAQAGI
jgi:hypothetical protein